MTDLNQLRRAEVGDPEIDTRIASYEMAYRMQSSVPELTDISQRARADPRDVRHASPARCRSRTTACWRAGWSSAACGSCSSITAAGTRTAPASAPTSRTKVPELCLETDRAATALVRDLKQRGLLDTTLVIWGGEFGRTPMNEARGGSRLMGRDHHPRAFTIWMAGGGVKPGITIGRTDDLGYNVVEDPVEVHDLHATILHLMGLDHTKLTYKFQGREFRLTDVHGERRDEAAGVKSLVASAFRRKVISRSSCAAPRGASSRTPRIPF